MKNTSTPLRSTALVLALLVLSGCAGMTTREKNTAVGAVIGGVAGNVIGGGDWATERLVPDILRALENGEPVQIRNPHAIRPWQHVLEPLSGYLLLAERLYNDGQADAEGCGQAAQTRDIGAGQRQPGRDPERKARVAAAEQPAERRAEHESQPEGDAYLAERRRTLLWRLLDPARISPLR